MDFVPDKEFHQLFNRVSRRVELKGCRTPADVNMRLRRKAKEVSHIASDNPLAKLRASNKADFYQRLVPAFGKRVIDEAHTNPNGKIALTLKHGWKKAQILFKHIQKRLGFDRNWKRKRR
jgi:hypothetical protein